MTNHSYFTLMLRLMVWAPYSYKRETSTPQNLQNHVSTPSRTTRQRSCQLKETTTSMSENYWRSLKPCNIGDHTSPGCRIPSHSLLTTLISCSGSTLEK